MTSVLEGALRSLSVVRDGYVVRNLDGTPLRDAQTSHATYRICRRAGLPERGWHVLRHYPDRRITPRGSWREHGVVGAGIRVARLTRDNQSPSRKARSLSSGR